MKRNKEVHSDTTNPTEAPRKKRPIIIQLTDPELDAVVGGQMAEERRCPAH
jgi:hypothetical protein